MNRDINSKFEELPEGYSCKLYDALGFRQNIALISPGGNEQVLTGEHDTPLIFESNPDKVYAMGDVRDVLLKELLGDTQFYYHKHGYGERTGKYLDACKANIGLLKIEGEESYDGFPNGWTKLGDGTFGSSDIYYVKDDRGHVAALQVQFGVDAFYEHRYTFGRKPSVKSVWDAYLIDRIETEFALKKINENFRCRGCDRMVHWLDGEGSLEEKWKRFEDRYCGC